MLIRERHLTRLQTDSLHPQRQCLRLDLAAGMFRYVLKKMKSTEYMFHAAQCTAPQNTNYFFKYLTLKGVVL